MRDLEMENQMKKVERIKRRTRIQQLRQFNLAINSQLSEVTKTTSSHATERKPPTRPQNYRLCSSPKEINICLELKSVISCTTMYDYRLQMSFVYTAVNE
ncbi:Hypothetical predicted protein [Octopus vulgaris]|uniref:Uncharacterized protein n=1 Tax=Octopus vulgaris TaxID=6645 RepID=A0AA36BV68_OCTVU|nr:Hypothetical predicted protein [Octopus vulgaris]